jgi:ubiquinone biosynthesis monooxygenase Coq7
VAGWLTGAIPSLVGPSAVYATIDAVETFVDHHYRQQIERLDAEGIFPALRDQLEQCRVDEVHHRDEARAEADHPASSALRAWCWLVGFGSQSAVKAAKIL